MTAPIGLGPSTVGASDPLHSHVWVVSLVATAASGAAKRGRVSLNKLCAIALVALAVIVGGVGAAQARTDVQRSTAAKVVVPNVVGMRMDRATSTLRARGLRVNEECSGLFGCIVKSR